MSVLLVGAYSWSQSSSGYSNSVCEFTSVSNVSVHVSGSGCSNCSAISTSGGFSNGANTYGGSMSVLLVGAYSWSQSSSGYSNSVCEFTSASNISVHVSGSGCSNCSAISTGGRSSVGANSYGGSMSVLLVGAYSWSQSSSGGGSSMCEFTSVSDVSVHVSGSGCSNCSAISTSGGSSYGANSYGGALSAAFVGAYSYGYEIENYTETIQAFVATTQVVRLSVVIQDSIIVDAEAASGEYCSTRSIPPRTNWTDLIFQYRTAAPTEPM